MYYIYIDTRIYISDVKICYIYMANFSQTDALHVHDYTYRHRHISAYID